MSAQIYRWWMRDDKILPKDGTWAMQSGDWVCQIEADMTIFIGLDVAKVTLMAHLVERTTMGNIERIVVSTHGSATLFTNKS